MNLIIFHFLNKQIRIYGNEYKEYFINSGFVLINKENILIKDINKININISDFKYEIMLLEKLYLEYSNKKTEEVNKVYNKIF